MCPLRVRYLSAQSDRTHSLLAGLIMVAVAVPLKLIIQSLFESSNEPCGLTRPWLRSSSLLSKLAGKTSWYYSDPRGKARGAERGENAYAMWHNRRDGEKEKPGSARVLKWPRASVPVSAAEHGCRALRTQVAAWRRFLARNPDPSVVGFLAWLARAVWSTCPPSEGALRAGAPCVARVSSAWGILTLRIGPLSGRTGDGKNRGTKQRYEIVYPHQAKTGAEGLSKQPSVRRASCSAAGEAHVASPSAQSSWRRVSGSGVGAAHRTAPSSQPSMRRSSGDSGVNSAHRAGSPSPQPSWRRASISGADAAPEAGGMTPASLRLAPGTPRKGLSKKSLQSAAAAATSTVQTVAALDLATEAPAGAGALGDWAAERAARSAQRFSLDSALPAAEVVEGGSPEDTFKELGAGNAPALLPRPPRRGSSSTLAPVSETAVRLLRQKSKSPREAAEAAAALIALGFAGNNGPAQTALCCPEESVAIAKVHARTLKDSRAIRRIFWVRFSRFPLTAGSSAKRSCAVCLISPSLRCVAEGGNDVPATDWRHCLFLSDSVFFRLLLSPPPRAVFLPLKRSCRASQVAVLCVYTTWAILTWFILT